MDLEFGYPSNQANFFSGGLELLFDKVKEHKIELDGSTKPLRDVIMYIKDNLLKERPELFVIDGTVYALGLK